MTGALAMAEPAGWFELPEGKVARAPAELRGLPRDGVRLLLTAGTIEHHRFSDLERILDPGDLLVVNDSTTLAAAVDIADGRVVHFSTAIDGGFHIVEIRRRMGRGSERLREVSAGLLTLPGGGRLNLLAPYPAGSGNERLWLTEATFPFAFHEYLRRHGRPITYDRSTAPQTIEAYQTVFARTAGSAEMPSAARPFTPELVTQLVRRGVRIAPITLHSGVSSLEAGERPYAEWYEVPAETASLVNHTRRSGHRVVAVGTTVVRALETVASGETAHPGRGWTDLYVTGGHDISLIDGLITGWHEATSTHLEMLISIAGARAIEESYEIALTEGYLWHEFGDSHLILT
ncbi:MAG TPA: S-adenosylmethionine:tRNA ribosyltransferase-isomerase [Acidimicrobiia bacterium]|nr:S-adenosylmethionine:tRNA ribosyltransferase-isomerase [Acidimicrobiia bacterium]